MPGAVRRRFLFDSASDPYQLNGKELSPDDEKAAYYDDLIRKTSAELNDPFLL